MYILWICLSVNKSSLLVKNNWDRSYNGVFFFFFEKQIGGNRDRRHQSTKVHFDSPLKIIEKKKKAAKIQRLTNYEQHSTPSLWSTFRMAGVWVTQACVIFNAFQSLISLLIKIKSFYEVYTLNSPYLWFCSTICYLENDCFHRQRTHATDATLRNNYWLVVLRVF